MERNKIQVVINTGNQETIIADWMVITPNGELILFDGVNVDQQRKVVRAFAKGRWLEVNNIGNSTGFEQLN